MKIIEKWTLKTFYPGSETVDQLNPLPKVGTCLNYLGVCFEGALRVMYFRY